MSIVYDAIYLLLILTVGWPYLLYRRLTRGPSGASMREWFGLVPLRPVAGKCVWIHGVSLGEINATRSLVTELKRRSPETVVVISSTTRTGLDAARRLYPGRVVFRFPLDLSFVIRTALSRIRPTVVVLMELETWPNVIEVCTKAGVPVVIANGRVTEERSMRRFRKPLIRNVARRMFSRLAYVSAQDAAYAARFVELGVPAQRVHVTGSVKYDTAEIADRVDGQETLAQEMGIDTARPLLVAGSTGPGEEAILLDAYELLLPRFPALQLAIIPRKPERFDEAAQLILERGFVCLRRSTGRPAFPETRRKPLSLAIERAAAPASVMVPAHAPDSAPVTASAHTSAPTTAQSSAQTSASASALSPAPALVTISASAPVVPVVTASAVSTSHVFLGDTMGELRKFYALATVTFVGRSLVPMGGSDVIEAAALAKPVISGPHTENFAEAVALLSQAGGLRVVDSVQTLAEQTATLLDSPDTRDAMSDAARDAVRSRQGATRLIVDRLLELMP